MGPIRVKVHKKFKCIVPNCTSDENSVDPIAPDKKVRLFGFPKNTDQFEKWCRSIQLPPEQVQRLSCPKICSRHFKPGELNVSEFRARIRTTAVPYPYHIEPPKAEKKKGSLLGEARAALKYAVKLKTAGAPEEPKEEIFGKFVALQLKQITDPDIYNETTWAIQVALREGIEKFEKIQLS